MHSLILSIIVLDENPGYTKTLYIRANRNEVTASYLITDVSKRRDLLTPSMSYDQDI